jgi:hypothetical protein
MIVLAILGTVAAFLWTLMVGYANGMRSSPGAFQGAGLIWAAWIGVGILWLAWWFS